MNDIENFFDGICRAGNVTVARALYSPAFIRKQALAHILHTMRNNDYYRTSFPKVLRLLEEKIAIPGRPRSLIPFAMAARLKTDIMRRWFSSQHVPLNENIENFLVLARYFPEILAQKEDHFWAIIVQQWALNLYPYRKDRPMKGPSRALLRVPRAPQIRSRRFANLLSNAVLTT